jgi:hypothetical protein
MFEDDDYCLRVRLARYPILWARDVLVHHEGHQSFRAFSEEAYRRRLEENRERFLAKWNVQEFLGEWRDELELINRLQSGRFGPWDLLRAGHYAEAYAAFERHLRAAPGEARGFVGLGLAAEGQGIPAAAALAYRTALSLAPQDPDATRGLARTAAAGGRG